LDHAIGGFNIGHDDELIVHAKAITAIDGDAITARRFRTRHSRANAFRRHPFGHNVIGEQSQQLFAILRLHEAVDFRAVHLPKRIVRRREDRKGSFAAQRLFVSCRFDSGEKARELPRRCGDVENVAFWIRRLRFRDEKLIGALRGRSLGRQHASGCEQCGAKGALEHCHDR
jgi:hypothetical protein